MKRPWVIWQTCCVSHHGVPVTVLLRVSAACHRCVLSTVVLVGMMTGSSSCCIHVPLIAKKPQGTLSMPCCQCHTLVNLPRCMLTAADVERPALKSPPSAPAGTLADKDKQHSDQAHKEQHSSSSSEHVHRSKSDPTGAKQRPSALPQKDTLTVSQKQTLAHVQVR